MRIPIAVINNDSVSGLKIEAKPACSCWEKEDEDFGGSGVELLQKLPTVVCFGGAVKPEILESCKKIRL